jgi:outer membrane protein, multidrug efflux system
MQDAPVNATNPPPTLSCTAHAVRVELADEPMRRGHPARLAWWLLPLLSGLGACSTLASSQQAAIDARNSLTPQTAWVTPADASTASGVTVAPSAPRPLPHDGKTTAIAQWWQHFDDPLLASLIDDAQASAPTVALALANVREARAQAQAAGASLLPNLSLGVDGARGSSPASNFKPGTQATAAVQAAWELDLFGGVRHQRDAAAARAEQARLAWHDARVTLAAEVAQIFVDLRTCEALVTVLDLSSVSQRKNAELTRDKVRVGFEAPANGYLADAVAADATNRLTAQRADCDALTLALSSLTGRAPQALREALAARRAQLPQPGSAFDVDRLPATVLAHRPDIAAAEQTLVAAVAEINAAQAARWPRIVFGGSIGFGLLRVGGSQVDGASWSIAPSLSLPIFDGGRIAAGIDAAQARREAAHAGLDQRIRGAVREVEEALVRLTSARTREADALRAAEGFRQYFNAAEQRWKIGVGSVIEMEEARRLALNAQATLLGLQRERVAAWISLYRAAGGGWRADDTAKN